MQLVSDSTEPIAIGPVEPANVKDFDIARDLPGLTSASVALGICTNRAQVGRAADTASCDCCPVPLAPSAMVTLPWLAGLVQLPGSQIITWVTQV